MEKSRYGRPFAVEVTALIIDSHGGRIDVVWKRNTLLLFRIQTQDDNRKRENKKPTLLKAKAKRTRFF